ncbi:MAG TPA: NAD(P)/FAD-dependent oxidoreductase [Caldimonas sp.]|nr:NAD(P)/FAD-dependent oxidoreductase [Caldimonas sp.]HEX4235475.1 NAD(P)/FAD-dependent oxidoreductase [Caldimonas sp.]
MRALAPAATIETDAVVVGAGPVGLFQVFELGLQEVRAHVVDALPHAGGQCFELYADKPIYDIPALPVGTGRELTERLLRQIEPFGAGFHLEQQVSALAARGDGRFDVATSTGTRFVAKAVVVAGGVGAFQPRRLKVEGLDRHRGTALFEHAATLHAHAGRRVVIVGGGESAVNAAIEAADAGAAAPASVTLIHRRDDLDAGTAALERLRELRASGRIAFVAGQPEKVVEDGDALSGLVILCSDGTTRTVPLDALFVLLGWSPKLGPIAEWGLALEKKQLVVDTQRFETSTPGIFAVGDVNTYPGKQKLIVCGFHEATLAAFAIGERVFPDRAQPLQYTTTSTKLHRLLGVAPTLP